VFCLCNKYFQFLDTVERFNFGHKIETINVCSKLFIRAINKAIICILWKATPGIFIVRLLCTAEKNAGKNGVCSI
jgi:hypothetical protein